jgi:hypothetical protein
MVTNLERGGKLLARSRVSVPARRIPARETLLTEETLVRSVSPAGNGWKGN